MRGLRIAVADIDGNKSTLYLKQRHVQRKRLMPLKFDNDSDDVSFLPICFCMVTAVGSNLDQVLGNAAMMGTLTGAVST